MKINYYIDSLMNFQIDKLLLIFVVFKLQESSKFSNFYVFFIFFSRRFAISYQAMNFDLKCILYL